MTVLTRWSWSSGAALAFVLLAAATVAGWGPLDGLDVAVADRFRRFGARRPEVIAVVRVATDVAATIPFLAAGLVAGVVLWLRHHRAAAILTAAATVVVPVLWGLMHWLLPHPRPTGGFVAIDSNGFPSGHTSNAAAAAVCAVLVCGAWLRRRGRLVLTVAAVAFAVLVGLTRLMLLAHWLSDVVGGWLLAVAVVPMLAHLTRGPRPATPTSART